MAHLRGEHIELRLVRDGDMDELIGLVNDMSTRGSLEHHLYSEAELRHEFEDDGFWGDKAGMLLIVERSGRIAGAVEFNALVYFLSGYEISYQIFGEEFEGKGYASEALQLFTAYLFSTRRVDRLQLTIHPDNEASRAVARKCGYSLEGVMRAAHFFEGAFRDVELWSITRADHAAS